MLFSRATKNEIFLRIRGVGSDSGTGPGLPRTSNPDSDTESTAIAVIGSYQRNSRRTAQHDTRQVESDTGGRRRPDF